MNQATMKNLLTLFLFSLLLLPSCSSEEPVDEPIVEEPEEPEVTLKMTNCSLAEAKLELQREPVEDLNPDQVTQCFSYGTTDYAFVMQPNAWNAMQSVRDWEAKGHSAWSGLLKQEEGEDWEIFFKIDEEDYNPVGFYVRDEDFVLDIADATGAGSGERTLLRYTYAFAGVTEENLNQLSKEKCDGYYLPESYSEDTVCN